MNTRNGYAHAPITEAIIELRVIPREDLTVKALVSLNEASKSDFSKVQSLCEFKGEIKVEAGTPTSTSTQRNHVGYKWTHKNSKKIWQVRKTSFTFSHLAPYESWEPFCEEANQLWNLYRGSTNPKSVTRLSVRYINRIDIPIGIKGEVNLQDYFKTFPRISSELPQKISKFFMQVQMPQEDVNCEALLNQTIIPPKKDNCVSVVLDTDLSRTVDVPQEEGDIWGFFNKLHLKKNQIFEASITEKTRKLFQ